MKKAKMRGYLLVRDVNGKPKFDDIFNIPDQFWGALTPTEQAVIQKERANQLTKQD